jgi:signal transduction histidine kinase/ligand-binding sensor domain-containing protein/CheY-like chemotaxis protein/AraC-like DNA-binding protein
MGKTGEMRWFGCRVISLLLLPMLFSGFFVSAQQQLPDFIPVVPETLSNLMVRSFHKDSRGFMWLGTADGLFRYDGTHIHQYEHNPADPGSLCHNNINVILEDSLKNLWIGTAQGLSYYDFKKDSFTNVDSIAGNVNYLNNAYVTSLAFDREGRLWIGTHGGGINIYDGKNKRFTHLDSAANQTNAPTTVYINALLAHGDEMWSGTKGGVQIYKSPDLRRVEVPEIDAHINKKQVTKIIRGKEGDLFLSTLTGDILRMIPRNGYYLVQPLLTEGAKGGIKNVHTLSQTRDGKLWLGGEFTGLSLYDPQKGELRVFEAADDPSSMLPPRSIRSVYVDDSGLTWIGTFNKGAFLMHGNASGFAGQYPKHPKLTGRNIRGFTEDHAGNVWIANDGEGVMCLDPKSGKLDSPKRLNEAVGTNLLTSILFDRKGNLWIGTVNRGAFRYNLKSGTHETFPLRSEGFGDNYVSTLYEDQKGRIWAGTSGSGLFYHDEGFGSFKALCQDDKPNFITKTAYVSSMAEDGEGNFWVGTMYGLFALREISPGDFAYTQYMQHDEGHPISSNSIQSLFVDREQHLWVGTTDNGLNILRKGSREFISLKQRDGMSSNTIRGIVADGEGNIWISGNRGLTKLDPETETFFNFSVADGLASNNFFPNAYLKSTDGRLYFGSNNGLNTFYPDSVSTVPQRPVVHLTDLKINNRSVGIGATGSPLKAHISHAKEIELTYEQRSFVIDFVAVDFVNSKRLRYCYRLLGFDEDWVCEGTGNSATYTNLDPGTYEFMVKAANTEGFWTEEPVTLKITIHPMPWKSWWALTLYFIILSVLVYFLLKIRIERIKMKTQLVHERMAREHEHALNASKTQFFTNVSHEFRTPLSLILMPLENLLHDGTVTKAVKSRLQTVYRNADKMMRLVNELLEFNKMESGTQKLNLKHGDLLHFLTDIIASFRDLADQKSIDFSVKIVSPEIKGWFDADKLEKIMVNVLANAFKFTATGGDIQVILTEKTTPDDKNHQGRILEIKVVDNGIGISAEELPFIFNKFYQAKSADVVPNPGTGIGLSLTKSLVELHQGSIVAQSQPDNETIFVISIPLDEDSYRLTELPQPVREKQNAGIDFEELAREGRQTIAVHQGLQDKPKVLVVEDHLELLDYLAEALEVDYQVFRATDGSMGIQLAKEMVPDLIISDILMAKQTGLELCRELKSDISTSHIPIVLLTAKSTVEEQIDGIENGADLYLTKPFNMRFLLTHVKKLIETRNRLFASYSQNAYLMPAKVAENRLDQEFLEKIIAYIEANIKDTQLGVDSIAEIFNLSRTQIYRKIKALTGKSVVEFIRTVRLKKALQLMDTQKYSLSEIAFEVGFNSASYFTRAFKETYGKAPSAYSKS